MRILEIIPSLSSVGGAEKFLIDLSISLKSKLHDVIVIVLYKSNTNFFNEEIHNNNIPVIYLNKKKGFDVINSLKLRKLIKTLKPDIVHTHIQTHLSMKLTGLWAKHSKIVFFHTIHSVPEKECPKPILFKIMKKMYQKSIVNPITISDELSKNTKSYYRLNYNPVTIYNGVFVEKFDYTKPIEDRDITFISVARFQSIKNQMSIARASVILSHKGYVFKTFFLGEGDELINVKRFVSEQNADYYIQFLGQVKNVNAFLANSKCFLLPSLFEGNPISILEAMASGLGVIATKNGGIKDVIENNVNGLLINPEIDNELVEKMQLVLDNKDLLLTYSRNNITKILKYDMGIVADKYLEQFNKALERNLCCK